MKVAIIHDWLNGRRGGEKVLESLCRLLPGADVFTLFYQPELVGEPLRSELARRRLVESPLARLPAIGRYYRALLPLMPAAAESFDLRGYELVVSSSHAVAKGARAPDGVSHICYCHTPMRYLWDAAGDYFQFGRFRRLRRSALRLWERRLRDWDLRSSARVTRFVANSENVRRRIRDAYGRDAAVIYPPVETDFFKPGNNSGGDYFLVVSALEPYKRVDLAIRAARRLGKRLVVAGTGSQQRALQRLAGRRVEFVGWVEDQQLRELYRGCRAVLFPGLEDFGIVPVEAQACEKPVVAYGHGGALETVLPGVTGVFFQEQSEAALAAVIAGLENLNFDAGAARRNSLRFSRPRFEREFREFLVESQPPCHPCQSVS